MKAGSLTMTMLTTPRSGDGNRHVLEIHSVGEVLGSQTGLESQLRKYGNQAAENENETWSSVRPSEIM
jgi:hypothetical protein